MARGKQLGYVDADLAQSEPEVDATLAVIERMGLIGRISALSP